MLLHVLMTVLDAVSGGPLHDLPFEEFLRSAMSVFC
jgi:hypothetical protein